MKKSALVLLAVASLLVACGAKEVKEDVAKLASEAASQVEEEASKSVEKVEEAVSEAVDTGKTLKLKIGATPSPHAEILEQVKDKLKEEGVDLEIVVFNDYVLPNNAVQTGDIDANYFQHLPYLDQFNAENKTDIVSVADIHYEPFGVYAGKTSSLEELKDGATVAVPNDVTNEARALLLLADKGLITLKEGADLTVTKNDIVENPKNLDIKELEAAQIPRALPDVDIAVINGNYAIEAGFKVKEALAVEDANSIAAKTYGNIIAVKAGNENNEAIKKLIEVLRSDEVKTFIEAKYEGAVVPSQK